LIVGKNYPSGAQSKRKTGKVAFHVC
jgi:hypothetical protein